MATTTAQAKQTVITALVFVGILTAITSVLKRHDIPPLRIYIGCMVAGIMLTLLAGPEPEFAASFAILIAVGAMFVEMDTIKKLSKLINGG